MSLEDIRKAIRDVPDFPKKGVIFKDITPALKNPALFSEMIDALAHRYMGRNLSAVAGIEARGYILAAPLAYRLGVGFVPIRKPGKLPCKVRKVSYALEYGTDTLEMHEDAIAPGARVLLVDDVLATGGTASGASQLIHEAGATVDEMAFLIELAFLEGRKKLKDVNVHALLGY